VADALSADPRDPHAGRPLAAAGAPLAGAPAAVVCVHGRGGSSGDILALGMALGVPGVALVAPQARDGTWYPYSFLAPLASNEPGLSSALAAVGRAAEAVAAAGVPPERTLLLGFSQGACLAAEFAARHARRWGGLAVFSGGLIGPDDAPRDYAAGLDGTPVFLGCSDRDPHIPAARVRESAEVFRRLGADVTMRLYPGMPHTVVDDELEAARAMLRALAAPAA
jgi:predicted esterase